MLFYAAIAGFDFWRLSFTANNIRPSINSVMFCYVMLASTFAATGMLIITSLVLLTMPSPPLYLADLYPIAYNAFESVAWCLTAAELLSLFVHRATGAGHDRDRNSPAVVRFFGVLRKTGICKVQRGGARTQ